MFTGIIEAIGAIRRMEKLQAGMRLTVAFRRDLRLHPGDSLAVDGVCLTCEKIGARSVSFVLSGETLERSRFGSVKVGDRVNLERALAALDQAGHTYRSEGALWLRTTSFGDSIHDHADKLRHRRIDFEVGIGGEHVPLRREISRFPFVPTNPSERNERCDIAVV